MQPPPAQPPPAQPPPAVPAAAPPAQAPQPAPQQPAEEDSDDAPDPDDEPATCAICTEYAGAQGDLTEKTICGHEFCFECIQTWYAQLAARRRVVTCPVCRTPLETIE